MASIDVFAGLVLGTLDRLHDEVQGLGGGFKAGAKPPSSPTLVLWPASAQVFLEALEDFAPMRIASVQVGTDRHDHEFLNIDRVVGVRAAVDDVHHRYRQHVA